MQFRRKLSGKFEDKKVKNKGAVTVYQIYQ